MIKILLPLSWIYGSVMALRNKMFDFGYLKQSSFSLPVISVGNIAVGGTGKTPHTEYLLQLLTSTGYHCAMLSRGYGRKTKGFYEANGHGAQQVGDEPWQVQQKFPMVRVCVCEKRAVGIQKLLENGKTPDVIILDDAFQHRYVKPGLSILLTDFSNPYYEDYVMPAGRLREFRRGAQRAQMIIVTKCPSDLSETAQNKILARLSPLKNQKIFFTYFSYGTLYAFNRKNKTELASCPLQKEKVLLLCGIARPKNLTDYLRPQCNSLIVKAFPDHHNFTSEEIQELGKEAEIYDRIITTEKDAARLSSYSLPSTFKERLWVQPIEVKFINQASNKFNKIITNYVTENTRNSKLD